MSRELARHRYDAFGVEIRSSVRLPELPSADGATDDESTDGPDVEVCRGDVEPVEPAESELDGRSIHVEPGRCRLTFETIGSFRIEDGERVVVDPEREAVLESKALRRLLEGQVLAVLFHQRGLLVLHASAVATDGRAALFVGSTGAGKTTTAAAFYSEGWTLVDDDLVVVEFDDGEPRVRPGVPELKLYPETAAALGIDVSPPEDLDAGSPKQYHRVPDPGERSAVPLAGCYRLVDGDELAVEPVAPREQVLTLISNTYTAGLLDTTDANAAHLRQCSRVTDAAPIRALERPEALDELPDLVELVEEDLAATGRGARTDSTD